MMSSVKPIFVYKRIYILLYDHSIVSVDDDNVVDEKRIYA